MTARSFRTWLRRVPRTAICRVLVAMVTLCMYGVAQDEGCPAVSIHGPAGIGDYGEVILYSVKVDPKGKPVQPTFQWSVSDGEIVSGQGTDRIQVRRPASSLTVTVKVFGLSPGCRSEVSESSIADPLPESIKVEVIYGLHSAESAEKFGRFAAELKANPYNQGYVNIGHSAGLSNEEIAKREKRVADILLSGPDKIDRPRITIVSYKNGRDVIELWQVPPGANSPLCDECDNVECPRITVSGPAGIVSPGEPLRFTATVFGAAPASLRFEWTVPNADIIHGQGSREIEVRPAKYFNYETVASLRVHGGPAVCDAEASDNYSVSCSGYLHPGDFRVSFWTQYGDLLWKDEKKELESIFGRGLKHQPEKVVYLERSFGRSTSTRQKSNVVGRIKDYVHNTLKIPSEKFVIRVGRGETASARAYLVPNDAPVLKPDWSEPCDQ